MNLENLQTGTILGDRYRLIRPLGKGGMGTVYLVEDMKLNGKCWALKMSNHHSLEKEAKFLTQLNHACLPRIVDYSSWVNQQHRYYYIVMDYLEGQTLKELMNSKHKKKLSTQQILSYAYQLSECFRYLHELKPEPIIYRDLKPSNVLIDRQHQLKLIDFGIARHPKIEQTSDTLQWGTLGFVSPEQLEGKQTDARSDLFSLGAMLYTLFTNGQHYYMKQQNIQEIRKDLSEGCCELVQTLLMIHPELRFQTARETSNRIKQLLEQEKYKNDEQYDHHGQEHQPKRSNISSSFYTPQKIIIGGLFAGAGATYTALAAARVLHNRGLPHAFIEYPRLQPELYGWIETLRNNDDPQNMMDSMDPMERIQYIEGHTEYFPMHPNGLPEQFDLNRFESWLYSLKKPITLIDISDQWESAIDESWFQQADHIWIVVEPHIAKYNSIKAQRLLQRLESWHQEGRQVSLIANRKVDHRYYKQWLQTLPFQPAAQLPSIPYEQLLSLYVKGRGMPGRKELWLEYENALEPLMNYVLPNDFKKKKRSSFFSKMISR